MNCKNCNKEIKTGEFCNEFCKRGYTVKQAMSELEIKEELMETKIIMPNQREIKFGKRYKDCTFDNFRCINEEQQEVLYRIKEITVDIKAGNSKIIAFVGGWGTGKDHLAAAMVHQLNNMKIIHTTVQKISRKIRESQKQQEIIDFFTECFLLIINEIGVQSVTQFERNILHEIIDTHYRNMTNVLLISNEQEKQFKLCIDEPGVLRVWDRIDEKIIFDWKSYRKRIKQEAFTACGFRHGFPLPGEIRGP